MASINKDKYVCKCGVILKVVSSIYCVWADLAATYNE